MANYTMTLEEIRNESLYEWFPSEFPFYIDDERMKQAFKEKFYLHYMNREIGYESPYLFVKKLEALLVIKMPYYRQLYETELKSKEINFLLNKDLKETYIREITGTNNSTIEANTNGTSSGTDNSQGEMSSKESRMADGVSMASLDDNYLTGASNDTSTTTNSSTQTATQNSNQSQTGNNTSSESYELLSQGNIGITSSAQLLKEWRDVLINIDEIIINDCKKLFMSIY